MAGTDKSPPTAGPSLQTVLTLTIGNSDERKRVFRWGTQIDPFGVGVKGAWYVHAPGVHDVHLYISFDGRMVQVAATQGATVSVAGALVGQGWHPVPVRTELRFGEAAIAVTCEEAPVEAPAAAERAVASPPRASTSPPAVRSSSPPGAGSSAPVAGPLGPRTLMVTTPEEVEAVLAEVSQLETALPGTGTLRLMERAWAPPTPGPTPPMPAGSRPVSRNTPHVPVMAPPGIATAVPPSPARNVTAPQPPAIVPPAPQPQVALSPRASEPPNAITQPPTAFAPQAPVAPLRHVITKPSEAVGPKAQSLPPKDAHPAEQITLPPTVVARAPSAPPPPPIAPVARVVPPTTPMPAPQPLVAPQSEAVPTMADGGALRQHAKRLESLPREAADPATLEYFSAVRAYSGKSPSEPPPNAPPTFVPGDVATPRGADNRSADDGARRPDNALPFAGAPEMGKAPGGVAPEKPKGGFRQSWKETSLVKKAILFLLPLAAAGTLLQLEPEPEPEPAAAPKARKLAAQTAAASAATEVAPSPPASGVAPAAPSNQAAAASGSAAALETTSVVPAASAGSVGSVQVPVAEGKPPVPVVPSAVAASSATSPLPPGSAVPVVSVGPASSNAVATTSPSSMGVNQPESLELAHQALSATFAGNLALATTLYKQLSTSQPDSQLFSLAARFTKDGAVRSP